MTVLMTFRLEQIIEEATQKLLAAIKAKEPAIVDKLIEYIARMDSKGGNFMLSTMNETAVGLMDKYIQGVLTDLGLNKDISEFVKSFDEAQAYTLGIQKDINGIVPPKDTLVKWRKYAIQATVDNLIGNGLLANFAAPIRKALGDAVYSDGSLTDVLRQVRALAETVQGREGNLLKYYTQVSRDAVGQYAGNVNRIVAKQYGLDAIEYVGSIVKDSRPQCIRWLDMEQILIKDLEKEIDWAAANGSGLIPGTTPDNFIVNRGGYNCRHEAIPVRSKK